MFGNCPVKININAGKFSYITKRNLATDNRFNFLGYDFNMKQDTNKISFEYGIAAKKINKYANIIERHFKNIAKQMIWKN